jgi:hypothetical protein
MVYSWWCPVNGMAESWGIDSSGFLYGSIKEALEEYFTNPNFQNKFAETIRQIIAILPKYAGTTKFIHPIIQYNSLVFHIPEEALNEFNHPEFHRKPFVIYLAHIMGHLTLDEVKMRINQIE